MIIPILQMIEETETKQAEILEQMNDYKASC